MLILVIITLFILCYFPSVYKIIIHTFQDAPFEIDYLAEIRRPLYTLTLCINLVLYAITFFYVHKFFNNLFKERIFVIENVTFSKRIALILLILAVISGAPDIISNFYKVPRINSIYIDENYLFGAIIIGALAKILEKANIIVEEHDLTI